jgi:DNA-binding winged helix-turn-helix (wHTH) protein/Tol biopolymer transport system component
VGRSSGSGTEASRTRRFGVFELDLRAGELRRGGVKVKIQEQPFQVLSLLLEKPGDVVTREDLRNRLWPADTFVDFDHSLNAAIRRVREALGDSAENPTFVETVARRGYRFLAPVSAPPVNGAAVAQPESPATLARPQPHRVRWIAGGAAAVALVFFGIRLGLSFARHHPVAQVQPRISRLTANPADDRVRAAAISRDGKYLAFSDDTGFYLRQIDTGETHPVDLPKGFVSGSIGWFPDSAHMVVALGNASQATSLWEVSALGGSPRKLLDDGFSPAVSPDGREIAFITAEKMRGEIWLMAADGEQPHKLVGQEGDFFGSLAWSPDGTKIAYTRGKVGPTYGAIGEIGVVDVRDQHVGSILQINSLGWFARVDGPLAWTADGRLIYAIGEPPPRQLDSNLWSVALDANGRPSDSPLRWTTDPGAVTSISASGDGKRIAYVKGAPQPDVYVAKLEGSTFVSEPSRLTLTDRIFHSTGRPTAKLCFSSPTAPEPSKSTVRASLRPCPIFSSEATSHFSARA